MAPKALVAPVGDSVKVFQPDIFNGKVLFATGGGSGIGKGMVLATVSGPLPRLLFIWSVYS
jgi:2,4-dienoyl-CoA reductase [(3E)-enoyl-CoA-producing], peroxisomal